MLPLPHQDLGSLGVPFLSIDEDGRSVLNKPQLTETKEDDKPAGVDQPPKPNEDFPDCTTYFYHRWMWIQVSEMDSGSEYEYYTLECDALGRIILFSEGQKGPDMTWT